MASSDTAFPARLSPASLANTGVGATDARAIRAETKFWPEASNTTLEPTRAVSDEAIQQASELAQAAAKPISDMRGTIRQRIHLIGVYTRRTLNNAIERARGG